MSGTTGVWAFAGGSADSIEVEPGRLEAIAGRLNRIATETESTRGSLSGVASAAAACDPAAADACAQMQAVWRRELALDEVAAVGLARSVLDACAAYARTDSSQMGGPAQVQPR